MMEKMREIHENNMERLKERINGGNSAEEMENIEPPVEVPDPRMVKVTGGVKLDQRPKLNAPSADKDKGDDIILPEIE